MAWEHVGVVERGRLTEARRQCHFAAQWLARAARAYVPSRPDDHHTNLAWDEALHGFETHAFADGATILTLDIPRLTLGRGGQGAVTMFNLGGRSDAEARAWLGRALRGVDAGKLDAPSPYEMPSHAIGRGERYTGADLADARAELAAWYGGAALALGRVRESLAAQGLAAPPVRCWPHHFDLDTLVPLPLSGAATTMGVGFSPGDDYYDEPYLYVSRYPAPDVAELPALPGIGHWHTQHFTAAVAVGGKIVAAKDREAEVDAFLEAATGILGGG